MTKLTKEQKEQKFIEIMSVLLMCGFDDNTLSEKVHWVDFEGKEKVNELCPIHAQEFRKIENIDK